MSKYFDKLFILEMANNHDGSVEKAITIINEAKNICEPYKQHGFQFAIKLQYRDLNTFIHPECKGNHDYKFVKRFEETQISFSSFKDIKDHIVKSGFISICTPFDENSVDKVIEHDFDIIKIASCSFTDWPLLEEIVKHDKPIIASCGAAELEDIDNVVSFMEHRNKEFALLHCVPEYPTENINLQLWQLAFLRERYKGIPIGYSQHNTDALYLSSSKITEFHVKLNHEGNNYSLPIEELYHYLDKTLATMIMGGEENKRYKIPQSQKDTIRSLQRGVYAKRPLSRNEILSNDNIYFAMPVQDENHLTSGDISKYKEHSLVCDVFKKDAPISKIFIHTTNKRQQVLDIVQKLIPIIKESGVVLPDMCEFELSAHYGLDMFEKYGAAIFNVINREYCKKIIIMLPIQSHPCHFHKEKTETFHVLWGDLIIRDHDINNSFTYKKGAMHTVVKGISHSFISENGCVFEEISTTHFSNDSFYIDDNVHENRKTRLTFRKEWLTEGVK